MPTPRQPSLTTDTIQPDILSLVREEIFIIIHYQDIHLLVFYHEYYLFSQSGTCFLFYNITKQKPVEIKIVTRSIEGFGEVG